MDLLHLLFLSKSFIYTLDWHVILNKSVRSIIATAIVGWSKIYGTFHPLFKLPRSQFRRSLDIFLIATKCAHSQVAVYLFFSWSAPSTLPRLHIVIRNGNFLADFLGYFLSNLIVQDLLKFTVNLFLSWRCWLDQLVGRRFLLLLLITSTHHYFLDFPLKLHVKFTLRNRVGVSRSLVEILDRILNALLRVRSSLQNLLKLRIRIRLIVKHFL